MMAGAGLIIPVLTAPAEPTARGVRQQRSVQLDSLHDLGRRVRGDDSVRVRREIEAARQRLDEADAHLERVVEGRRRHWSVTGPGTILVGFGVVLALVGMMARRW
jgi:hypothetical protein